MADPITIGAVVMYLAKKLKDNKDFQEFTADFTQASINWIRPILLKPDSTPKEVLVSLKEKPDSEARRSAVVAAIATDIEDHPDSIKFLSEIAEVIDSKQNVQQSSIINSTNANTGNISAGGSVIFNSNK